MAIPYIHVPDFQIGPIPGLGRSLPLHPFGLLVATGVIVGTWLATWRARRRGLDEQHLNSFITWMLVAGFMGGHMLDEIFYHPAELMKRPQSLFFLWEGLSSFGGFTGALIGVVLWKYFYAEPFLETPLGALYKFKRRKTPASIIAFCDLILSVFPVAWIFGRGGCTVVHDHKGALVDSVLSVEFPKYTPGPHSGIELIHGPELRFDLGLLEWMFTVFLALAFALTWTKRLPVGTYIVATALSYSPVRFMLDYFRLHEGAESDPRYGGLTPGQWASVGLFVFGLVMWRKVREIQEKGLDLYEPYMVRETAPTDAPNDDEKDGDGGEENDEKPAKA
jgi:phosphatidylglycerol:prolipoprotein diacylglycerol transferase